MPSEKALEQKAVTTGKIDAFLSFLFTVVGLASVELLGWALTLLPMLTTYKDGTYRWATVPLGIIIGAIVKGVDRRVHESPDDRTGLISI